MDLDELTPGQIEKANACKTTHQGPAQRAAFNPAKESRSTTLLVKLPTVSARDW